MAEDKQEKIIEESKAPLLEHLIELRQRMIYAFASVIVLFFVYPGPLVTRAATAAASLFTG